MALFFLPFTWGSGGGGAPPAPTGIETWVHPIYARPLRAVPLGDRNQHGAFSGRVRNDADPADDTFFNE